MLVYLDSFNHSPSHPCTLCYSYRIFFGCHSSYLLSVFLSCLFNYGCLITILFYHLYEFFLFLWQFVCQSLLCDKPLFCSGYIFGLLIIVLISVLLLGLPQVTQLSPQTMIHTNHVVHICCCVSRKVR